LTLRLKLDDKVLPTASTARAVAGWRRLATNNSRAEQRLNTRKAIMSQVAA
jgi:hypothetical protein